MSLNIIIATSITTIRLERWSNLWDDAMVILLQKSEEVNFFIDQVRRALGSGGCLIDWLIVTLLKNLKTALFQTFQPDIQILSALTALYWPSTAFFWLSTAKYRPVPPSTEPVPSYIDQYPSLLNKYDQVSMRTDLSWPSTICQPVPSSTDPVPPSTNYHCLLLTQCHHISTSPAPYWLSTIKYHPVPTYTSYTVVAWGLQTPAQFTQGLVFRGQHCVWWFFIGFVAPTPLPLNVFHELRDAVKNILADFVR